MTWWQERNLQREKDTILSVKETLKEKKRFCPLGTCCFIHSFFFPFKYFDQQLLVSEHGKFCLAEFGGSLQRVRVAQGAGSVRQGCS